MAKPTVHSGKARRASSHKTNNRDSRSGAFTGNVASAALGGGKIKSKPSNPRYQKTQNAKTSSGKVPTKKLKLADTQQSTGLNAHEKAMSPDAIQRAISKRISPKKAVAKSTTVKDLRNYLKNKG